MRFDWKIGDDPEELKAIADRVVRGESIVNTEIKSLRKLIEAVQVHRDAKLAPPRGERPNDWRPPDEEDGGALTTLSITGGTILEASCDRLDVRLNLACSARFEDVAVFEEASFAGNVSFEWARFAGDARFYRASFAGDVWFVKSHFAKKAGFTWTTFVRRAYFRKARFAESARFGWARFARLAMFDRARFSQAALFSAATFAHIARFNDARVGRMARFDDAAFVGKTWFDGASFVEQPTFGRASFRGEVSGDLRCCYLRTARFAEAAAPKSSWAKRAWRRCTRWSKRRFGWQIVRNLGQLAVLNRVSLLALIAVPVVVALQQWLDRHLQGFPAIGPTLALAFLAAVAVTLGLLIYQVFAPEEVRKLDLDAFVDRAHQRYPENASDRDDGLRRAIEHLEQIALRRPDRHPSFVKHHGDTIWVPPRDRIEWFNDPPENEGRPARRDEPPSGAHEAAEANEVRRGDRTGDTASSALAIRAANGESSSVANEVERHEPRGVSVRGAERRRIVIEEGARAEYWIKSREKIAAAWVSFLLYLIGIGFLLVILVIQINNVLRSAGWLRPGPD